MKKAVVPFVIVLALLAGCQKKPQTPAQSPTAAANAEMVMPPETTDEPLAGLADEPSAAATEVAIPGGLQGRWGLAAADCVPNSADAKGLMTVSDSDEKFYESVGKLGNVISRGPMAIRAQFAFTGEAMSWTREMSLESRDGGKTLVRTEYGAGAMARPQTYMRCP